MKQATVRVPGSCGELVQGTLNGQNFLITCPINCYSEVTVSFGRHDSLGQAEPQHAKAHLAVDRTLRHFQTAARAYHISVRSLLPVGKGMASSSADIGAACLAAAACLGAELSPRQVADIALSIEPTDAVFFPGINMFDHRCGRVCEFLGRPPDLEVLIFDLGGEVDTLAFNARTDLAEQNIKKEHIIKEAVALVREGIRAGDPALVGKAATLSALANQAILAKARLEEVLHLAWQSGALGVNVAHSGTVAGVLLDPYSPVDRPGLIRQICQCFGQGKFVRQARLIGGGWEVISNKERTL